MLKFKIIKERKYLSLLDKLTKAEEETKKLLKIVEDNKIYASGLLLSATKAQEELKVCSIQLKEAKEKIAFLTTEKKKQAKFATKKWLNAEYGEDYGG